MFAGSWGEGLSDGSNARIGIPNHQRRDQDEESKSETMEINTRRGLCGQITGSFWTGTGMGMELPGGLCLDESAS